MQSYSQDDIYNILHDEIIKLKLKPGQVISETTIAKRFNVSRTPIRGVFNRLSQEDLINVYPQRGSFVSLIDTAYVDQIIFMRRVLEMAVISDAVEKIKSSDLDYLNYNLAKQEAVIKTGLPSDKFFDLDNQFHKSFFKISGKEKVWEFIEKAKNQYYRYRMLDMFDNEELLTLYQEHKKIFNCITSKDMSGLYLILKEHLSCSIRMDVLQDKYTDYFLHINN